MKVLFMCLGAFDNLEESSVHIDILKQLAKDHEVWLACKNEDKPTEMTLEYGIHVLRIQTGQLKKVGLIKKGINTVLIEPQFKNAIKKHLSDVRFDLVLYTTPPITFASSVDYLKRRDGAITYLMLKDIFPQNAVDLGMMSTEGIKGQLYRFFRQKEKQLYKLSDYIGCMSPANIQYILEHNTEIDNRKVGICANCTNVVDKSIDDQEREIIRKKYGIPVIIDCLKECKELEDAFFMIVGNGTEYDRLFDYISMSGQGNVLLMKSLPKDDYDKVVAACDVGLLFLDHRFTIPNFPSRILPYMQAKLPILACTDPSTDVGRIIENEGFGWWCESNSSESFKELVDSIKKEETIKMGERAYLFLANNYNVEDTVESIINTVKLIYALKKSRLFIK